MRKFFEGLGWFSGEVFDDLIDGDNNQIYTIRFNDDREESWSAHDVTLNDEAASISIGDVGFQFNRKICGGGHFSGIMIEILCSGKMRCGFCDIYEYRYTLKNCNAFRSSMLFLSL